MYTLRFDMRAPEIGAPTVELYSAATDMCEWAESHGALAAVLCEHHGAHDGYLPSPLILASAIAGRTRALPLSLILLLPFYDPVRLAEDMAVLDIISKGRASYILALGYRPEEFEHFGVDIRTRGRIADEKLALLRELLTGETVFDGRRINATPEPYTEGGPMLMWGGGSVAAARRAGRYGLGMLGNANVDGMQEAYQEACRAARARTGADLPTGPRNPVRLLRRRRRRHGVGRDRSVPAARRARVRRLESGQRLLRGLLRCEDGRRAPGQPDVAPDLQRLRSRDAGALGGGAEPFAAVRRSAARAGMAVPEAGRRGRHVRGGAMTDASAVDVVLRPLRFRDRRRSLPGLEAAAGRGAAVLQREVQLLRVEPLRRRLPRTAATGTPTGRAAAPRSTSSSSGMDVPPGIILFEDPPIHDLHRKLLSRVFTPRRMEAIEPLTRRVLRARDRATGWLGPVRLHRRHRCDDPDADNRIPAGHSRGQPGDHSRQLQRLAHAEGRGVRRSHVRTCSTTATGCSPSTSTGGPTIPPTT